MILEETFDTGEVSLNIARGPANGPPLVLLHGVLRRWSDFLPIWPALAARWQLFGVDFRGHGDSGFTTGDYLVVDYVRDAVAVVRDLLTEPCVLYGHSLGAMVAAATAAELPERVRAVVLEDPPFETMGQRIRETAFHSQFAGYESLLESDLPIGRLAAALADVRVQSPDGGQSVRLGQLRDGAALRYMASCMTRIDPAVLSSIAQGRWLDGYGWEQVAEKVRCPALVLQADTTAGGMLVDADVALLRERMAEAVFVKFPQVGHLIHWAAPQDLLRVTTAFLESLR